MVYVLAIVAVVTAIAFIIGYYFFKKDALYVLGIGAAVSSNVYNVGSYGITEGGIVWGIDAIIYALFVFCIIVACKDFDRKSAMAITYSSIGGIMLTAFFDFMAKWMSAGFAEDLIWGFVSYAASAVSTFLGVYTALLVYDKLRDKVYIGQIENKKEGTFAKGEHEPIISNDLFNRVQSALANNSNNKSSSTPAPNILTGKLFNHNGEKFINQRTSGKYKKTVNYYAI